MRQIFYQFMLPGLVFQSVVIGGGYATGRELVEFFLTNGPLGGLLGLVVTTVLWSLILLLTFELARMTGALDYRAFFRHLLGRFWFLYEIPFFLLAFLILSVLGSAAGNIVSQSLGLPELFGIVGLMAAIAWLSFQKSTIIEKLMAGWAFVLYIAYSVLIIWGATAFHEEIFANFSAAPPPGNWFENGFKYATYNIAAIPAVLFALGHLENRKQAFGAGLLGGPLAILPAVFLFIVMVAFYPDINSTAVPLTHILGKLDVPWFSLVFQIVIFGTFIQTGTALIHMLNERIDHTLQEQNKKMPQNLRPVIALAVSGAAVFLAAKVGIIDLIAQGYGLLTWGFLAAYIVPIMTVGAYKIFLFSENDFPVTQQLEKIKNDD
ncbi:hypothetical protein [Emcibacter sp.]|uniref:YkvI family membrane protein n=1 Tax=Emcibacter sp. TaxID=1979954 RepID=UPI002AA62690|nr:hypothetical protein [Emcibacter sp.]